MAPADPSAAIGEVVFDAARIAARVRDLGAEIGAFYGDRRPLLVGVLRGSFPFVADLVRAIPAHVEVDFVSVGSYGRGTESTGVVRLLKDLDEAVTGRDVILVEDVIDTGRTLRYLLGVLEARRPASLEVCALLVKEGAGFRREQVRFRGFDCPNRFVVGYGLDRAGLYRNLPYVGVLRE